MPNIKKTRKIVRGLCYLTIRHMLSCISSLFIKRSKSVWAFGSYNGNNFFQNSKFLFLYVSQNEPEITAVWISKSNQIVQELQAKGYNAYTKLSFKGIYYALRAKYYISDWGMDTINSATSAGAHFIALWHGIPLKKLENDIDNEKQREIIISLEHQILIYNYFGNPKLMISASEYDREKLASAFYVDTDKIVITGFPKLDIIFNKIENSDLLIKKELTILNDLKSNRKKVILLYMPTFRDTGRNPFDVIYENKKELDQFLTNNNCVFVCKAHVCNKLENNLSDNFVLLDNSFDIYPMLKIADILITDYSSIYFDFLLTNKPIIFFPYDIETYVSDDRSLYVNYNDFTPGEKAYDILQLINSIKHIIDGCDAYIEARNQLKNKLFVYQDGDSSLRTTEIIKSL